MPWTIEDVDRFKKGLSQEQKERWVAIANGVLESCLAHEHAQREECERMAIATASSRIDSRDGVVRYDAIREIKFREENGLLIAEIAIAKPDVYPYHDPADGKVHYEFKPPEEILSDSFLAQSCLLPITDEHPAEGIVSDRNIERLMKGITGTSPRIEGNLVVNTGAVYEQRLKDQIKRGDKRQVSIGFRTVVLDREGEYNGKKYDRVQTMIRLNHLAFTKAGRCGEQCAIVIDGRPTLDGANGVNSGGQMFELKIGKETVKFDCPVTDDPALLEKMKPVFQEAQTKIDDMSKAALEVVGSAEKIEKEYSELKSKHDALTKASSDVALLEEMRKKSESKSTELQKKYDDAQGQLEKANAELSLLKGQVKASEDLKATFNKQFSELMTQVDGIVDERLKLIQYARQKQPHYVYQGKANHEIKRDLVKMINPEVALDSLDEQQHIDAYLKAWMDMEQHVERAKEMALNNITRRVGSDVRTTSTANSLRDQTMKLFGGGGGGKKD